MGELTEDLSARAGRTIRGSQMGLRRALPLLASRIFCSQPAKNQTETELTHCIMIQGNSVRGGVPQMGEQTEDEEPLANTFSVKCLSPVSDSSPFENSS